MESKVAALPREKLESLALQAVERTKKESANVQTLAGTLESLRAANASVAAQVESIEQDHAQLLTRKAQGEEDTDAACLALSDIKTQVAQEDISDDVEGPCAVEQHLRVLEMKLSSELELAKQRMQEFKLDQDSKVEETVKIVEHLQREVERGTQLIALQEEKDSLQVPLEMPETVHDVGDTDIDAVSLELAAVVDHVQELQSDICDRVDAHQRMLHVRHEELEFISRERQALETKRQKIIDDQNSASAQQESLIQHQHQLDEERERERTLRELVDRLQSECDLSATELDRVREANSTKLKELAAILEAKRETEQEQMVLVQAQADLHMLATERMETVEAEKRQKLSDMQSKADERLGGLQQKIDAMRQELEDITGKSSEKDALCANAEEMKQKYEQVMQQASTKIQNFEAQSHQLSQQLKTKQEELLELQGKYKTNARAKAVVSVEEGEKVWFFTGEHWFETTDCSDTLQSQAANAQKRAELDLEHARHTAEHTKRAREHLEQEFDAYKQRAQLAEESNVKQHHDLRQAECSVADMDNRLNALLLEVKVEQETTSAMNQRLRSRRMEYGKYSEVVMDIDVEIRSLESKSQAMRDQLRLMEKSARVAQIVTEEKTQKEFQARLRDLELDLQLQNGLIPRLRIALEELEAVREPSLHDTDIGFSQSPTEQTPRNEILMTPPEVQSADGGEEEASKYATSAPVTSQGWNELMKHRELLREEEDALREEKLRDKQVKLDISKTLSAIRTIKEKNTLEENLQQPLQLEYIRNIFAKFLDVSPVGSSEHEQLLRVVMTFFQFSGEELAAIEEKRRAKQSSGWGLLQTFGARK